MKIPYIKLETACKITSLRPTNVKESPKSLTASSKVTITKAAQTTVQRASPTYVPVTELIRGSFPYSSTRPSLVLTLSLSLSQ
jgi:hypothetical protein